MSREERREALEDLEPAERRRLFRAMRAGGEGTGAADRQDPGRPRPAYVFKHGPEGSLEIEPIVVGLSSWEYTEVIEGMEPGEEAVEVPLSLIQQQELLQRFRERSGMPGVSRD